MTATEATATAAATYSIGGVAISAGTAGVLGAAAGGFAAGVVSSGIMGASPGQMLQAGAISAVTMGFGKYMSGLGGFDPKIARFATGALRGGIETGSLEGALKGGLVNELPTDLGVGKSYLDNRFVNFLTNTVREAGQGYAINGKAGAERSVFGSLANGLVGHALGLISSGFEKPTFKDGMYWYASKSSVGRWLTDKDHGLYGAITFGNVVNTTQDVIDAGMGSFDRGSSFGNTQSANTHPDRTVDPQWTYVHEMDHYATQDILGAYYLPLQALSQGMGSAEQTLSPYRYPQTAYLEQWPFKLFPYGR